MKSILSILTLCLSLAVLSGPLSARAANDSMKSNLKTACKSDMQKFCSDITPGQGREMACMKSHEDKLSSGCSQQWNQAKAQIRKNMKQMRTACAGDVQKFCSGSVGPRDIGSCLNDHESDLSASCKNIYDQMSQMRMTG